MKLIEIICEGGINWSSQYDEKTFVQLASLVKRNNGLWKSAKQAQYLLGKNSPFDLRDDEDSLQRYFGIKIEPGQKVTSADGSVRWSEYGGRSVRPVTWMFVLDDKGVVAEYKLGYVGDMRRGTHPEPSKTKLVWSRPQGLDTSHLEQSAEQPAQQGAQTAGSTSQHVGNIGDRVTLKLKVKKSIYRGMGDFGPMYLTISEDEKGNLFFYTGGRPLGEDGETIDLTATINKHIATSQGEAATVLKRPRVKKK